MTIPISTSDFSSYICLINQTYQNEEYEGCVVSLLERFKSLGYFGSRFRSGASLLSRRADKLLDYKTVAHGKHVHKLPDYRLRTMLKRCYSTIQHCSGEEYEGLPRHDPSSEDEKRRTRKDGMVVLNQFYSIFCLRIQ